MFPAIESLKMFIGGQWVDAASGERFESVDPATGTAWAAAPAAAEADVDRAVAAARSALDGPWGAASGADRARLLRRLADLVAEHAEPLARLESRDNGKLLRETLGVVSQIPDYLQYFAGLADTLNGETIPVADPNYLVYTLREPVGVVAGIVPWNNPLMILIWKVAPALAAGCACVVKASEHTPASSLELARLFEAAGFPGGVLNIVTGPGHSTGRALVRHPGVDKISFTGSTTAGVRVMQDAAEHLAQVTLELGGKSPNIVFADADLDAAATGVVSGVFASTGQMCTAGARLLVQREVEADLLARLRVIAKSIRVGDPMDSASEMGPVATAAQLDRVHDIVASAQGDGATLECGGGRLGCGGFYVEPTILSGVGPGMRVAREEVFGPVLAALPFDTEEEAVALANDTAYGLAAGVWTSDVKRAHRMARAIRSGMVWINCYRNVAPNVPFGGVRQSGFGRENGTEVVRSHTTVKSVWVEIGGSTRDPFRMA